MGRGGGGGILRGSFPMGEVSRGDIPGVGVGGGGPAPLPNDEYHNDKNITMTYVTIIIV